MAIYVGETITIVAAAFNPLAQAVIADATATVDFYAPGKNPAKNPDDRTADKGPANLTFSADVVNKDGSIGAYVGYVETDGWAAGKWSYKVTVSGAYDSWEYGTFTLVA